MARPLVHHMVHKQDRPGFHNWLTVNAIAWSDVAAR
jgi:hypothetical protein